MKCVNIIGLVLIWTNFSYAQMVTIVDQPTGMPLEGAVLIDESHQLSAITNMNGQADISIFMGIDKIKIRSLGYKSLIKDYNQIQLLGFKIELEPSFINIDEVVVSATRWQQSYNKVPAKIISISTQDVALHNPQTAADLLGISGKVFVQKSQQGGGSPMIRGFATNRLIYIIDGVRMNTAIFRGGNLQNVINLDPFAIEHTEVLFGPGSVIYGSDAIGGVMSFQTFEPKFSLTEKPSVTGKAIARYSSANKEHTAHFDVNIGWKKWAFVTSLSSWDFDHLKQGSHGPDDYIKNIYPQRQDSKDVVITQNDPLLQIPSAYSQFNQMHKVRFRPNEKWDFQYGFHYSETSPYGRYDRHNRFKNGTIRYAEWNYGPQIWMMNNFSIEHTERHAFFDQMSFRLAQQTFKESRIDRALNANKRTTNTEHVEAYSVNLDLKKNIGLKNVLFYGLEYVLNDVASKGMVSDITTGTNQLGPARYPNSTWQSIDAYANDALQVSNKLTLQAGLRYNQFVLNADFYNNIDFFPFSFSKANVNNGALTGSFGGVYKPSGNWVVKASIGTAFRSPNVDDLGKVFDSAPNSVVVPNPDLKAEFAYNFDLNIAKVFGDWLKFDVSGYYTTLKNALVRRDFQLNGQDSIIYNGQMSKVQAIQNAAVANVYGFQTGVEIKLPASFTFISDLNFQVGEEELDNGATRPSRHAAPLFGVSRLRYKHTNFMLELNTMYQGERCFDDLALEEKDKDEIYAKDADGNNYAPSWYTVNLKANYQLSKIFSLSSGIENITNQRYRPYSSGISGSGRNFILSVITSF